MAVRYESRAVNQSPEPVQISVRSLLLVSSGTVWRCEKESMLAKLKKRLVKWGVSADGRTAYLSIQHSNDPQMQNVDDHPTDDVIKTTGFRILFRFDRQNG